MSDSPSVVLEREYNASIDRVFDAWTKPESLRQWFRGSEKTRVEDAEVDLKIGGPFRIVILGEDSRSVAFGSYVTIERPTLLEFSFKWESSSIELADTLVRVELESIGERTKLRLIHTRLSSAESVEAHSMGWNAVLDSLNLILEKNL